MNLCHILDLNAAGLRVLGTGWPPRAITKAGISPKEESVGLTTAITCTSPLAQVPTLTSLCKAGVFQMIIKVSDSSWPFDTQFTYSWAISPANGAIVYTSPTSIATISSFLACQFPGSSTWISYLQTSMDIPAGATESAIT